MPYKDKEKEKEWKKKYNEANKDKINEYQKNYRETNKEQIKEYKKEYYEENKEKFKEKYEENKEYKKEYDKKYCELNKERIKKDRKNYRQTEEGKKSIRISNWKFKGVICDDFDKLYEYYLNCWNCEECNVELIEGCYGNNKKCLDHNHTTGLFRNVLCNTCNTKRGFIDNNIIKLTTAEKSWKYRLKTFILS